MLLTEDIRGPFPNFTTEENMGKRLFMLPVDFGAEGNRVGGGLGCAGCHGGPEFAINPNSRGNGVVLAANGYEFDEGIHRSPTLRDIFNPTGELNGPLMHNGLFTSLRQVLEHYNDIEGTTGISNPFVDPRLKNGAHVQKLNMTEEEYESVIAFFKTLTGNDVYTNEIWSDPFDENGQLEVFVNSTSIAAIGQTKILIYPNPAGEMIILEHLDELVELQIIDAKGQQISKIPVLGQTQIKLNLADFKSGLYLVSGRDQRNKQISFQKFVKL